LVFARRKSLVSVTGLPSAVCSVVFTLAENTYNFLRVKWKTWLIVVASWLMVKLVFVSVLASTEWFN
jgi:hypothetical protein